MGEAEGKAGYGVASGDRVVLVLEEPAVAQLLVVDDVFRRLSLASFGISPGTPIAALPPAPGGCVDRRRFSFVLHHPRGERIVRIRVLVNGATVRVLRGHDLNRLTINRLPAGRFTVTIRTLTDRGTRATSSRVYSACTKTPPRNRFRLGRRRR